MSEPVRPFLKWAGGKRRLLPQMLPHLPARFGRYHEPFMGSAALFFHLGPRRAVLSDTNDRLIRAYQGLRDDPDGVIELLSSYRHDRAFFERMRKRNIDARSDVEVAAWLIYLNKTGYNGLYRVNSKNGFNVPFGRYEKPAFYDPDTLRRCSAALAGADIKLEDFAKTTRKAKKNDLVYFDPPYVPLSATSSFASYTKGGFGPEEQERLRDVALELKKRGVWVLLSNSSAPSVWKLYEKDFDIAEVRATRVVNSKASGRGAVTEVLIY